MEEDTKNQPESEESSTTTEAITDRPTVVELKDGKVNVKTFGVSMSRRYKFLMLFDLLLIGFTSGMFTYVASTQSEKPMHMIFIAAVGLVLFSISVVKTIMDFDWWRKDANGVLDTIGEWYAEDFGMIASDLIVAGTKVASEEAVKAKEENDAKETEKKNP